MEHIPDVIKLASRNLRANQTKAEKILWEELRNKKLGYRFLRQRPIHITSENNFNQFCIPDFYCSSFNLIIELDGSIHELEEIMILDNEKEKLLNNMGYKILRLENKEVYNNIDLVLETIKAHLK